MLLLNKIATQTHFTELLSSDEIARAEEYEAKGWIVLRRTKMSKGVDTYGHRKHYAHITDAGRRALEGTPA